MAMGTGTEIMVSKNPKPELIRISIVPHRKISKELLFGLFIILHFSRAEAVDWKIEPTLNFREIYSDNINLGGQRGTAGDRQREDSFVTQISPGISIQREGRSRFRLRYRMQNIFYAGTDISPRINNQLQMNSHTEIWDDAIFVDSSSTIGQYNGTTSGRVALDNVSRGDTREYRTFRISPYWRPHFGGYAEGIVRVTYSNIGGGGVDSNMLGEQIQFQSGRWFDTLMWRANFFNQEVQRDSGNGVLANNRNVSYRNYNGELRYRLTDEISPFFQAGNFDNDFAGQSRVSRVRNGSYWTGGLAWTPSSKLTLQAGAGSNNYFGSLVWEPTRRTMVRVFYRDSDVGGAYGGAYGTGLGGGGFGGGGFGGGGFGGGGFGGGGFGGGGFGGGGFGGGGFGGGGFGGGGFGGGGFGGGGFGGGGFGGGGFGGGRFGPLGGFNAGTTWNALLTHRTRRTNWYASYGVMTTTIQQVLLDQNVFVATDPSSPTILNPDLPTDQPDLTNEVITRERAQIGVSGHTAKTTLTLTGYQENREYQFSGDQDVLGFTTALSWRFTERTRSLFRFLWQSTDSQGTGAVRDSENRFFMVSVSVYRNIWTNLTGSLEFRHFQQMSNRAENEYQENRVTAGLNMRF
ncbi:TIGR03016 family PEP-CTERM system-associated outer membrane protein [Methylocaldum marinum]|uniref:TIGR03016 family PEP-CTERM system-associated outer membrane protein n=1 Tax=Methylocaldum marinum TaxID=1432792 RepID=UPI000E69555A|nr:TIGR03016 family PEP-CTERM system-associated outer membrane protein [Methylocaldum marinum]